MLNLFFLLEERQPQALGSYFLAPRKLTQLISAIPKDSSIWGLQSPLKGACRPVRQHLGPVEPLKGCVQTRQPLGPAEPLKWYVQTRQHLGPVEPVKGCVQTRQHLGPAEPLNGHVQTKQHLGPVEPLKGCRPGRSFYAPRPRFLLTENRDSIFPCPAGLPQWSHNQSLAPCKGTQAAEKWMTPRPGPEMFKVRLRH